MQERVEALGKALNGLVDRWRNLDDQTKKRILTFAAIVAAIGPVLLIIGKLIAAVKVLAAVFTLLVSPVGLTIAAIAALAAAAAYVYANWESFSDRFKNLWARIHNFMARILQNIIRSINNFVKKASFGLIDLGLDDFKLKMKEISDPKPFGSFGDAMKKTLKDLGVDTGALTAKLKKGKEALTGLNEEGQKTETIFTKAGKGLSEYKKELLEIAAARGKDLGVLEKINSVLAKTFSLSAQSRQLTSVTSLNTDLPEVPQLASGPGNVQKLKGAFTSLGDVALGVFDRIGAKMDGGLTNSLRNLGDKIAALVDTITTAFSGILNVMDGIFDNQLARIDERYEKERAAINANITDETLRAEKLKALEEKTQKQRAVVEKKKAKVAKARAIFESIINTAVAVTSVIANPILAAIVAGLGAAQTAIIAAQPLPALQDGGLLYGDTLFRGGEYPGASINPEVVAPLDRLEDIFARSGARDIRVYGEIRNEVIALSNERAVNQRVRRAGF